jgi:hypothetical protein
VNAWIEIGTAWMSSERFSAVTTTVSIVPGALVAPCAPPEKKNAAALLNRISFAEWFTRRPQYKLARES